MRSTRTYVGDGLYSGKFKTRKYSLSLRVDKGTVDGDTLVLKGPPVARRTSSLIVSKMVIEAAEKGKLRSLPKKVRKITPERFLAIKHIMDENGRLGEEHVLNTERKRLKHAKRQDLAEQIHWVSQESIDGYDIISFETTGEKRFIEVKSTVGNQKTFEMSDNEWQRACQFGNQYFIYRVTRVRDNPSIAYIRNPKSLEELGKVKKTTSGWRVTYSL